MPNGSIVVKVKKTVVARVSPRGRVRTLVRRVRVEVKAPLSGRVTHSSDQDAGIRRERFRAAFRYRDAAGKLVRDAATLERIRALAVPPAWERVWICPLPTGHIQATGWDARGRKQYRYHPAFRARKDTEKFARLAAFGRALPWLRKRVAADLAARGLTREKVLAAVVRLLDRTHLRVGNAEYARTNRSFGLSTLQDRHVSFPAGKVRVQFRGKSGVRHDRVVSDRQLATVVRRCRDVPGQHLFQYRDEQGEGRPVGSADVNEYIRECTGGEFTAKDFRTWAGTVVAAREFADLPLPESKRRAERAVVEVVRAVSAVLGNTPAVCRKSYVHPRVIEAYFTGQQVNAKGVRGASADEARVLRLLESRDRSEPPKSRG